MQRKETGGLCLLRHGVSTRLTLIKFTKGTTSIMMTRGLHTLHVAWSDANVVLLSLARSSGG